MNKKIIVAALITLGALTAVMALVALMEWALEGDDALEYGIYK